MRILLYTETALPKVGGQELVVDALARQFLALGHEVVVLAPHPRLPLRARDRKLPYRVERHPRFFSTTFLTQWYSWFLKRLRRSFSFDVIHCHGIYPTGYLASLCQPIWPEVPVLITSHGGDVQENSRRLEKPILIPRRATALQAADALISISGYTRSGFLRLGVDAQKIIDLPNGVHYQTLSTPVARPQQLDVAITQGNYFLFLGRLNARKGVDVLLHALAQLPERDKIDLVIAGDGKERPGLEQMANQYGLAQRIRFVGGVSGDIKTYLLQNARCLIVPSRRWEAFGLVVLEAYAAGVPVIASRLPGIRELVEPGQTGWLVEAESVDELAGAMTQVLALGEGVRILGEQAQRRSCHYAWPEIARRHVALYADCITARCRLVA